MKCKIPEISWHNRDPVLSIDIQPRESKNGTAAGPYRLATGGADSHVLLWSLNLSPDGSDLDLDFCADLTRHQRAVNAVKWSPSGELLASGDDESVIFIWKQKAESDPLNVLEVTNEQDKEIWLVLKVLRGHMEDIYDLSWSPNSQFLVSGSVDNTAIIWDVHKGKSLSILNDHKGFVQGVAWDPKNQYIATLSTDRHLRIFDIQTKRVVHRINKGTVPVPEGHDLHGRRLRLFHDDTLQTFFRRLNFTPDGKLLLTPAGVTDYDGVVHPLHTTYAFSRYALKQPAMVLPCPDQYAVAVRSCPLLFALRPHNPEKNPPVVPLPYRMIFAVATRSSVYFYDTQQKQPFAIISNIHYTRLTDITWSDDGRIVVVSSTDGFCSLITFGEGELGEEYAEADAVLRAALSNDVPTTNKKTKKQKENEPPKPLDHQQQQPQTIDTDREQSPESNQATKLSEESKPTDEKLALKEKEVDKTKNMEPKVDEKITKEQESVPESTPAAAAAVEIILDKEIISCDEKFESPEKKSPATPISIRRHPRTPKSEIGTPATSAFAAVSATKAKLETTEIDNKSPISSLKQVNTPRQQKRATPIAVRRTPRALITTPAPVKAPVEEAMDAWPLDDEQLVLTPPMAEPTSTVPVISKDQTCTNGEATFGCTQDIHLVYEVTQDEDLQNDAEKKPATEALVGIVANATQTKPATPRESPRKQTTPGNRTPRRVALTTLSTPKSKKKLLD